MYISGEATSQFDLIGSYEPPSELPIEILELMQLNEVSPSTNFPSIKRTHLVNQVYTNDTPIHCSVHRCYALRTTVLTMNYTAIDANVGIKTCGHDDVTNNGFWSS
nr:unnamed protein product [Fasciola hepatica]CAK6928812.1 unnamed protein product [Fasciola hepatica]